MEIDQMVDIACKRVGSDDLGDDTWREGLEVLVRSLVTEAGLNEFSDEAADELTDKFKDPQTEWHQAYFSLAEDEALVVEVMPPACEYWMIALHNHWMETLDYVHHQSTLNCHSATLEADGSVRFVVAHHDPGVPNWLDTAGHDRGTVGVRWVGPDVVDVMPSTRVVPLASLS